MQSILLSTFCLRRLVIRNHSSIKEDISKTFEDVKREKPKVELPKSCIFLPGNKAHVIVSVVKPDIDAEEILTNVEANLRARKLPQVNWKSLANGWKELTQLRLEKDKLEKLHGKMLNNIRKNKNADVKSLATQAKEIRQKMKAVNGEIWDLEDKIVVPILALPNKLHEETPVDGEKVIAEFLSTPKFSFRPKSHAEMGEKNNEIRFCDLSPTSYFLKGKAALAELKLVKYINEFLEKCNYKCCVNPDFCKPILIEACGRGFMQFDKSYILESIDAPGNELHLTGGASLPSFYGSVMRRIFEDGKSLPKKYFTVARCYRPVKDSRCGLFSAVQSTGSHFFTVTESNDAAVNAEYDKIVKILENLYKEIGMHFRAVNMVAEKLKPFESLRTEFQMWSPGFEKYVRVGNVSICGDYISRRLMAQYKDRSGKKYVSALHGKVMNISALIGCIMENTQNEAGDWMLPDVLNK